MPRLGKERSVPVRDAAQEDRGNPWAPIGAHGVRLHFGQVEQRLPDRLPPSSIEPGDLTSPRAGLPRVVARCSTSCYTARVPRVIAQRELRNQNARILAAVEAGESFVVTRNGAPVAELRPLARGRRPFVPRPELAATAAEGPHLDAAAFRRDLDAAMGQALIDE